MAAAEFPAEIGRFCSIHSNFNLIKDIFAICIFSFL